MSERVEQAEKRKRILCLGDSNTYGFDPRSYLGARYPRQTRWTSLLSDGGWDAINAGQNGLEIPSAPAALDAVVQMLRAAQPLDAVSIMLGTNDLLQNPAFLAQDAARGMERLLVRVCEEAGSTRIILIAPPSLCVGDWVQDERLLRESARLGECYAALARMYGVFFAAAQEWDIPLMFDGVHFTPQGHVRFASKLLHFLNTIWGAAAELP